MSDDLQYDKAHFQNLCANTTKAIKGNGSDSQQIKSNIEKMLSECNRLAQVAE